ncbi:MAG TPA: PaaX family transcriptional regulator C-terminal domain-containing protein, partial [Eoetvoesiella sp.]
GRSELRRELVWAGFGAIAPGIFAVPRNQAPRAQKLLNKFKVSDKALVLGAHELNLNNGLLISDLISQCWDLQGVAQQYQSFSETFKPILHAFDSQTSPELAFSVRALTIHEWRRIVLHDPQLPQQMLPSNWPGHAARQLCGRLYWKVFEQAERYLNAILQRDSTHYQALKPYVYKRFGGNERALPLKS